MLNQTLPSKENSDVLLTLHYTVLLHESVKDCLQATYDHSNWWDQEIEATESHLFVLCKEAAGCDLPILSWFKYRGTFY